jgi:hypothetical protein
LIIHFGSPISEDVLLVLANTSLLVRTPLEIQHTFDLDTFFIKHDHRWGFVYGDVRMHGASGDVCVIRRPSEERPSETTRWWVDEPRSLLFLCESRLWWSRWFSRERPQQMTGFYVPNCDIVPFIVRLESSWIG